MEYATPAQLAEYIDPDALDPVPPANALKLIRQASSLVADAIRAAVYRTDQSGAPLLSSVSVALREATCAQAAAWHANDIDPSKGRAGAVAAVASKSLGGASVQYASYAADTAARSDLASGDVLVSEALRILDAAGLLSTRVQGRASGVDMNVQRWPFDPLTGRIVGPGDALV